MPEPSSNSQIPPGYRSSLRGCNAGDYADQHFTGQLRLASGQEITLALVADGYGENGLAASVAQLVIDTVLQYLRRTKLTDIPGMLETSYHIANKRVREVIRRQNNLPLSSTLAAAVIHQNQLYIANVGNSRIYLVRDGQMLLLTVDHTVAYEVITSGRMNTDQALQQPNAQQLSRSIGFDPSMLKVDLGLYLHGGGEIPEQARQQQGLKLHPNDLVLVCSDGLVKPSLADSASVGSLAGRNEICKILETNSAQAAVQSLAAIASQRRSPDDVTAIVLEMPGRALKQTAAGLTRLSPSPAQRPAPGALAKSPAHHSRLLWISLISLFAFAVLVILVIATMLGFSFLNAKKATGTFPPGNPQPTASSTPENVQFPPTNLLSATVTLTSTTTFTHTPQSFTPTPTNTRQLRLSTATLTPTFRLPPDTLSPTLRNSPKPQPSTTDWLPTLPTFPTLPPFPLP